MRLWFSKPKTTKDIVDTAKAEVDAIVADAKKRIEQQNTTIQQMDSNLAFWKREFAKRALSKKCQKCKVLVKLWPFEETSYYIDGDKVWHGGCK